MNEEELLEGSPYTVEVLSTNPKIKVLIMERIMEALNDPSLDAEVDALLQEATEAGSGEDKEPELPV